METKTHAELVAIAAKWLRYRALIPSSYEAGDPHTIRCGVVLAEMYCTILERPDAIGWSQGGRISILVECKASRSDFLADRGKVSRTARGAAGGVGVYRYYLTNPGIAKADETPKGWGLLQIGDRNRVELVSLSARHERTMHGEMAMLWSLGRRSQESERTSARAVSSAPTPEASPSHEQ